MTKYIIIKLGLDMYLIEKKNDEYKVIQNEFECSKRYNSEYWLWWMKSVNYSPGENVDILILNNEKMDIDTHINDVNEEEWKIEEVMKGLKVLKKASGIEFRVVQCEKYFLKILVNEEEIKINTNKKVLDLEKKRKEKNIYPKGSIAEYFMKKTIKYKDN